MDGRWLDREAQWAKLRGILGQVENLLGWESQDPETEYYQCYRRFVASDIARRKIIRFHVKMVSLVNQRPKNIPVGAYEQCSREWLGILEILFPKYI